MLSFTAEPTKEKPLVHVFQLFIKLVLTISAFVIASLEKNNECQNSNDITLYGWLLTYAITSSIQIVLIIFLSIAVHVEDNTSKNVFVKLLWVTSIFYIAWWIAGFVVLFQNQTCINDGEAIGIIAVVVITIITLNICSSIKCKVGTDTD
jgi:hypothetical protein